MFNTIRASVFGGHKTRNSDLSFTNLGHQGFIRMPDDPEKEYQSQPSHLQRNKTERKRLQGLMRSESSLAVYKDSTKEPRAGMKERFNVWMINEGQRVIFFSVWILIQGLVFALSMLNYIYKDNLTNARRTFGNTYPIARSAAMALHVDVAFILLPICRTLISLLRRTPLQSIIPFDKNIVFHKVVAWSMVFWTIVHVTAHMFNFAKLANSTHSGVAGFFKINFSTGPGVTGWIMTLCLALICFFAIEKRRKAKYERFWYSHHLFIVFFVAWGFHGMFCMIRPDDNSCNFQQVGVFWKYWFVGGAIFTFERILREIRARHRTYISKVIQHPSRVVEIQIKKEKITTRPGQYIFLNCPEISYFQWHPFTLSSAPQEGYISIHVRMAGDFTKALAKALGCDPEEKDVRTDSKDDLDEKAFVIDPPLNRVLPRIQIDGPFGAASEDYYKFETIMLCAAGVGVTPFASILKSIWYNVNYPQDGKKMRLRKVYFFWICRDYESFEWFASLLAAIEEQDLQHFIEIHTYLTYKVKDDEMHNIMVSDVGSERDAVTKLRAPTHYGRPNWDRIFANVKEKHASTDVGVFFCGPKPLSKQLHQCCTRFTDGHEDGVHFHYGKENF